MPDMPEGKIARVVVQDESEWGTQFTVEFLGLEVSMHEDADRVEADAFCAEVNNALSLLVKEAVRKAMEDARLAYMSHTFKTPKEGGESCEVCGENFRSGIHFRVDETKEKRIRALAPKGDDNAG